MSQCKWARQVKAAEPYKGEWLHLIEKQPGSYLKFSLTQAIQEQRTYPDLLKIIQETPVIHLQDFDRDPNDAVRYQGRAHVQKIGNQNDYVQRYCATPSDGQ